MAIGRFSKPGTRYSKTGGSFIGINLDSVLWNNKVVIDAVDKAQRKNLLWMAGWIRKVARRSMRYTPKISKPGNPPSAHTGILRDSILYAWDPMAMSAVVGPLWHRIRRKVKAKRKARGGRKPSPVPTKYRVPQLLEFGGTLKRAVLVNLSPPWSEFPDYVWTEPKTFKYRPRPYMAPALAKAVLEPRFLGIWKGSVSGMGRPRSMAG